LPLLECAQADEIEQGDELEVELEKGEINDITKNKVFKAEPYPDFMLQLISMGGLIEYTMKKIETRGV
jgi:3-isopropylmalate/(R)-2-methylmalate dehydratase small subunit